MLCVGSASSLLVLSSAHLFSATISPSYYLTYLNNLLLIIVPFDLLLLSLSHLYMQTPLLSLVPEVIILIHCRCRVQVPLYHYAPQH